MSAPSAGNEQPWHFVIIADRSILEKVPGINPYAAMAEHAPLAILICGDIDAEVFKGNWVQDCAAATQNILLAAHALGFGAVWTGIYPEKARVEGFRKLLKLPENIIPFALVPMGLPAQKPTPQHRFNQERIHFNSW